jgi:predicted transcriptional regulator
MLRDMKEEINQIENTDYSTVRLSQAFKRLWQKNKVERRKTRTKGAGHLFEYRPIILIHGRVLRHSFSTTGYHSRKIP